jgi:hypothetical protein
MHRGRLNRASREKGYTQSMPLGIWEFKGRALKTQRSGLMEEKYVQCTVSYEILQHADL